MAKSPITTLSSNTQKCFLKQDDVSDLNLSIHLSKTHITIKFNLRDWCHLKCDKENPLAKTSRLKWIEKLYKQVNLQLKNGVRHATLINKLYFLKVYISYCDMQELNPFSRQGYLSYFGCDGALWRQVSLATYPKSYLFQYSDGDELGIKEKTAFYMKVNIDLILELIGFEVHPFQAYVTPFKRTLGVTMKPYQSSEWRLILRRLNFYFTSLATQLIAYRDEYPDLPPPTSLEVTADKIRGKYTTVCVSAGENHGHAYSESSPFSQCMAAGYFLFAYYTAFNSGSILDVRHPITEVKADNLGRTITYTRIRAYKARSSKYVQALFASSPDENTHPSAQENMDAGYITADLDKRNNDGIQDGLAFIQILKLFSKAYSDEKNGWLFYSYDKQGIKIHPRLKHAPAILSHKLGLFSARRSNLTNHFIGLFEQILDSQILSVWRKESNPDTGGVIVRKKELHIHKNIVKKRAIPLAFAALKSITEIELLGIIMPLRYSEKDEDGNVTVYFDYESGEQGSFTISAKYQPFLKKLEAYSAQYNPLSNIKGSNVKRTSFLLPFGSKSQTSQWGSVESIISNFALEDYGLEHGDFLLDLSASRIRKTTSHLEYKEEDRGFSARQILQHEIQTQDYIYANGHPQKNMEMISQGVQILTKIAHGVLREDAIEEVKQELSIPILSYEEYKSRNTPTNPNGISCNGRPEFIKTKNHHYTARKFAEEEGLLKEGEDLSCYQYDLCIYCKSASLVDDSYSIYKLLSFLEMVRDAIDLFPEQADYIVKKITYFEKVLANLPVTTKDDAEAMLDEKGRYPLFKTTDSVIQHLSFAK
ncbi:TPA: hypothetical protein ACX6RX_003109 [Photobacterium damselae]